MLTCSHVGVMSILLEESFFYICCLGFGCLKAGLGYLTCTNTVREKIFAKMIPVFTLYITI